MKNLKSKALLSDIKHVNAEFANILSTQKNIINKLISIKNLSILIPTNEKIKEIKNLKLKEKEKELVKFLVDKKDTWRTAISLSGMKLDITNEDKNVVLFNNNNKAVRITTNSTNNPISYWKLATNDVPYVTMIKVGKFENKDSKFTDKDTFCKDEEAIQLCKQIHDTNGFYNVSASLYNSLSEAEKQIADYFMVIPYADFFFLYDSTFMHPDMELFKEEYISGPLNLYNSIFDKVYMDSNSFDKLYNHLLENPEQIGEFYREIGEREGIYSLDGEDFKVCPAEIADKLYSMELFAYCMKKIGQRYETAEEDKMNYYLNMVDLNCCTNIKSTEQSVFDEGMYEDISELSKVHEENFKEFGLLFLRPKTKLVTGGVEFKKKNRMIKKLKKKIKLNPELKKKLIQQLSI